jgi:hypothetical protein
VSTLAVLGFPALIMYYPHMATVIEKRRADGRVYYYLVESARVDGKPRIVSQQYLGSAAEIAEKLAGAPTSAPVRSQHKRFGDLAAAWSVIERIGVVEIVDRVVPRRADAAASVGTYLALACANRIVTPCSKLGFADWWATTAGPRWVKLNAAALDHRRFWSAMDRLSEADLATIETELATRIVAEYGLDLCGLVLDMTNFATYIDSGNDQAPIAQRGKAKQKRVDLRLVGLGLVVTRDGSIPLLSHAYPGDRPDVTQFPLMIEQLVTRFAHLAGGVEDLTLVYDAGQNSATNHEQVEAAGIGFVGSLPPSDHPDLLAIGRTRYRTVDPDRFPGLTHVDTTVTALGVTRRAVLTHSKTLHAGQSRGFDQTLTKAQQRLAALADKLARGKTRRSRTVVEAEIATICKPRWVAEVLTTTLTGDKPADLRLSFAIDAAARKAPGNPTVRQTDPVHQPRHLARRRGRGGLPLPIRRGVRLPPTQRSTRRVVLPDAPLDRPEDPRPRVLHRARPDHRPPHAPHRRTRRPAPVRTRTDRRTVRHRRDRSALPRRWQRPTPRPTPAHRHDRHPTPPLRPVRPRPLRTHPLTHGGG